MKNRKRFYEAIARFMMKHPNNYSIRIERKNNGHFKWVDIISTKPINFDRDDSDDWINHLDE